MTAEPTHHGFCRVSRFHGTFAVCRMTTLVGDFCTVQP
jgi:hypothetical protein